MFEVRPLGLEGVVEILPKKHGDQHGFFSETWNRRSLSEFGIDLDFVQDNHTFSEKVGTLRGLHFQTPPQAQDKLVRVMRGAIFDIAVDIRGGSPQFGRWIGLEISAEKWNQIFIPKGFAHGFVTLQPDTEVIYKVTNYYSPRHDRAIRYDDPAFAIEWPHLPMPFELSEKDQAAPFSGDVDTEFTYQ
jgi:dTDP-4-dehydrorhamnose 3,5-epimerase